MSTYQLEIDGSGAEAGADRIVKSFDAIKAAADRMEGGVAAAAKKASSSFAEIQKAARPISDAATKSLQNLSNAMKNFRAPSDAAVRNTIIFLQGLKSVGTLNLGRVSGLAQLTAMLAGFKGPTPLAGKNTLSLLNALRFASSFSAPRGLAATLTALGSFRGPSAAGARATASLLTALAAFKPPRGLNGAAQALDAIARAAQNASGQIRNLNAATVKVASAKINVNTSQGQSSIAALTKSHGLLHGAIFKTQTMYNALGGILAARAFINASNSIIKIQAQLEAATGSVQQGRIQFEFLREQTERLGLEFTETARSYGFFLGAIKGTGVTFKDAQDIFRGFSTAARALQLSVSDVDGIFRALGQIMSKGKLQAEELRGQLGDRLPGAFIRFAAALDMTKPGELDKALKDGAVSGKRLDDAIISVSKTLELEFSPAAAKMSKTVDASFNRLKNAFTFSAADAGTNGLNAAIISITDALTKFLQSEGLNNFMFVVAKGFQFLGDNIELVAKVLTGLAIYASLKWIVSLNLMARAMTVLTTVTRAFLGLRIALALAPTIGVVGTLTTALKILGAVIMRHPIMWLAAVVLAIAAAYRALRGSVVDVTDATKGLGSSVADITNYFEGYTGKVIANSNALGREAERLRDATLAQIDYNRAKNLGATELKLTTQRGAPDDRYGAREEYTALNGQRLSPGAARVVKRITDNRGVYKPISNKKEFDYATAVGGILEQTRAVRGDAAGEGAGQILDLLKADMANLKFMDAKEFKKRFGFDRDARMKQHSGDYNHENVTSILSGDPLEEATKKAGGGGGKSEAEQWADDLERALRQAEKAITDLNVEADATGKSINGLLSGSLDTVAASAQAAARGQLKTFEDAFETAEKAQEGVMALAQKLQGVGSITADTDVSTYDRAKEAVTSYMQTLQDLAARREKSLDVAKTVAGMREENAVTQTAVDHLNNMKMTLADVSREREIETALIGIADQAQTVVINGISYEIAGRKQLYKILGDEIDKREALKRAEELAGKQRELASMKKVSAEMAPIYASGASDEDISYYREMFELRESLINQNWAGQELRDRIAVEAGIKNEERAQRKLNEALERGHQFAADLTDTLIKGFRDIVEGNKSFLSSFKSMFKEIKNIVLDFVLYNPLKKMIQDSLTGAMTRSVAASGVAATGYSSGAGVAPSSSVGAKNLVGMIANAAGINSPMTNRTPSATGSYGENGDIVVRGSRLASGVRDTYAPIPQPIPQSATNAMQNLAKTFAPNQGVKAFNKLTAAFKKGAPEGSRTEAVGDALQAVGTAYAAYQMGNQIGKSVAKALGGGQRAQNIAGGVTGGAAAGYTLGGPIGAAVGAVVGGVIGLLKKIPKIPSTFGSVSVGSGGFAEAGKGQSYGPADKKIGGAMAKAGATLFNNFAQDFDANLSAGKYGTFGKTTFKIPGPNNNEASFYTTVGVSKKGKPLGREGVDWVKGTDSEVQAFALITQVRKGMITGLTDTIKTVFANTKAGTMEDLNNDLATGKAYDAFVKGSFKLSDVSSQVLALNETYKKLSRQARELGLNETKLLNARDKLMGQLKEDFDFQISQGILGIKNPALAGYNALVKEYRDTVESAMAVGGDLVAVEELFGLKRAELAKQWADQATNGMVSAAKDLYTQLTATQSSPLNAGSILANAGSSFSGLRSELNSGNYANAGNLSNYATNYLDAARSMYGSSGQYFDIFNDVTEFLQQMSAITGMGPGGEGGDIPSLPSMDSLVAEINAQSLEMIKATGQVGAAVIEGSTSIVDAIHNLGIALGADSGSPTPVPTSPTNAGTVGTIAGGGGGVTSSTGAPSGTRLVLDTRQVSKALV